MRVSEPGISGRTTGEWGLPGLVALDLDDTLLDRDSRLPPANRRALERALELGAEIVLATGRAYVTITEEMRTFPGIRYAITGNGAAIYDQTTDQAVMRRVLPEGAAVRVLELLRDMDVAYETFLDGAAYAQSNYLGQLDTFATMDRAKQEYVLATRRPVPDIIAFIREYGNQMDSLAVIPRDLMVKKQVMELLRPMEEVYITTSAPRLVEINHRDCTKQQGLKFLAGMLGIPREKTAAFGNADNDAEMLSWAGVGVAVADATPMCLEAADYVTGPFQEEGVAEAFRNLFGI